MRDILVANILSKARKDKDIILLTADLGFGVLEEFSRELPNQFINTGIAEQNMTGMAAGLALDGRLPFTYSIGNFPTMRCFEQIRNDILYHKLPVNIIAIGGGFSYGQLGISHHATEDIGTLRPLPNLRIFCPCDALETNAIVDYVINNPAPSYIRIDKSKLKEVIITPFNFGSLRKLRDGLDVLIVGYGGVLQEAFFAATELEKQGISCAIYSAPTLKPFDSQSFVELAKAYDAIITLEEHSIIGGLASIASEAFMCHKYMPKKFTSIALDDNFCSIVGTQDYLRESNRLTSTWISKAIIALLVD